MLADMSEPNWLRLLVAQLTAAAALLAGIGLVAIGVSGALSAGLGATAGKTFVSADATGVHYGAARCADFREYAPGARSCEAAATAHHFDEVVWYRGAAGVLGLGVLGGLAFLRRRHGRRDPQVLPDVFVPTIGVTVFGGAAVALIGQSVDLIAVHSGRGAGQFLSGGIVAAVVAVWLGLRLLRDLGRYARARIPATWQPA